MTYEESLTQLEQIVRKMESGEYSIDQLAEQLKTAQQLIAQCKEKLYKTDTEIKKILEKSSKNLHVKRNMYIFARKSQTKAKK